MDDPHLGDAVPLVPNHHRPGNRPARRIFSYVTAEPGVETPGYTPVAPFGG